MEKEIKLRVEEGDFPKAIQLCLDCKKNVSQLSQFSAVHSLNGRLQVKSLSTLTPNESSYHLSFGEAFLCFLLMVVF